MSFPMILSSMDTPQVLSELRIGAFNVLEDAGIEASSTSSGFDPYSVVDGRPSTYWKPATPDATHTLTFTLPIAKDVNSFGIYSTDFAALGVSILLQYSVDGGVTWLDCAPAMAPAGTAPMYISFTSVFAAYFRVVIYANMTLPSIGVIYAGKEFRPERGMCVGFAPPTLGGKPIVLTNNSMAGSWLGRAVRSRVPYEGTLEFDYIPPARARAVWKPLIDRLSLKPFFLKWHGSAFPYEIAYCWTEDAGVVLSYSKTNFMSTKIAFVGLVG